MNLNRPNLQPPEPQEIISRQRLQELLAQVDPRERLDTEAEDVRTGNKSAYNDLGINSILLYYSC